MTIQIELPPQLHQRLATLAAARGQSVEECAAELLGQTVPAERSGSELGQLLRRFREEGDVAEQKATGDFLIHALDEDRPSFRKLFPPDLEGKTW